MRPSGRDAAELRSISLETGVSKYAEGSCLAKFGDTHVLCTASTEDRVPPFLRNSNRGWVTAEYGMLPRSTGSRMAREAARGRQGGRTMEIQRLIGRSLRAVMDLKKLGERTLTIDCDVLQADGGTRTASITGGYVAMADAVSWLMEKRVIKSNPLTGRVASVSAGIYEDAAVLDLDYEEDSRAETDMNFVMNEQGDFIEVQGTAEGKAFTRDQMLQMVNLAGTGVEQLIRIQSEVLVV